MALLDTQKTRVAGNQVLRDGYLSDPNRPGLWATCPLDAIRHDPMLAFVREGCFRTFSTGEAGFVSEITEGGSASVSVAAAGYPGGALRITAGNGADNDEANVASEDKNIILAAAHDVWFETEIKFTEANTDDANVLVGLTSDKGLDMIKNDGAGPTTGASTVVIYKVDGGTDWLGVCNSGTTASSTVTMGVRVSGSWQRLGFHVRSNTQIDYYLNGNCTGSLTSATHIPTAAMYLYWGVKNGGANDEVLYVRNYRLVQLL